MAIQQRRGAKADFDATKMLPGELAVTTDGSRKVYVAFTPGDAKELASTEDVEETIQSGIEEIEQKKEEALAQFPNYEEKLAELEVYKANSIISTSSGTVFHETDCAAVPPINIKLFGKSKQDGIPSMETPIIPVHHGESGSIGGKVLEVQLFNKNSKGISVGKYLNSSGVITDDSESCITDYIQIPHNANISISGMQNPYFNLSTCFYDENKNFIIGHPHENIGTRTLFAPLNAKYLRESFDARDIHTLKIEIGSVTTEYEPYTEQPFAFQTPNGLRGIPLGTTIPDAIKNSPIHMSGVYWDEAEGQYYIADTKNEDGKDVQRIGEYVVDGNATVLAHDVGGSYSGFAIHYILPNSMDRREGYCNKLRVFTSLNKEKDAMWLGVGNNVVYAPNNSFFDATLEDYGLANFKAHLNENPLKIWTWLDEPIITDTTAQYDVVMNYPNTTIVNDAGAYMEVEYVADTKKHIEQNYVSKEAHQEHENRIAELEKAIVNS